MINASLARPVQAQFDLLRSSQAGSQLHFEGRVTNLMATSLPATARVHVIVYEQHSALAGEHITTHILRAHVSQATGVPLVPGASMTFTMDTAVLSNVVDWTKLQAVVLVDYRPGGASGAYDMLQAAMIYPLTTVYLPLAQ